MCIDRLIRKNLQNKCPLQLLLSKIFSRDFFTFWEEMVTSEYQIKKVERIIGNKIGTFFRELLQQIHLCRVSLLCEVSDLQFSFSVALKGCNGGLSL
jgi:hypothetical protein